MLAGSDHIASPFETLPIIKRRPKKVATFHNFSI
jgi:hypothetical protein